MWEVENLSKLETGRLPNGTKIVESPVMEGRRSAAGGAESTQEPPSRLLAKNRTMLLTIVADDQHHVAFNLTK